MPIVEYEKSLLDNVAKGNLVRAATATRAEEIPRPDLYFTAPNDNILKQQITEAQKPLADLDYRLRQMHQFLAQGEADRKKITEPRWRASYDLAMGRVLAMRVRAFGYNSVLAQMKVAPQPFKKEGNNAWRLVPSDTIDAGPQVKDWAEEAKKYLTRVIDEHPGTPWAMLAERELGVPMGWQWREQYDRIADLRARAPRDPQARLMLAEEERKSQMRREQAAKRQGPNL